MTHVILKEQEEYKDIESGHQNFFIHKIEKYAIDAGETIIFQETKQGDHTGNECYRIATKILSEGLTKKFEVVGFREKEQFVNP